MRPAPGVWMVVILLRGVPTGKAHFFPCYAIGCAAGGVTGDKIKAVVRIREAVIKGLLFLCLPFPPQMLLAFLFRLPLHRCLLRGQCADFL